MRILAVDIGTGTQDILYLDTRLSPENAYKLVLPAPTLIIQRQIRAATRRGVPLALEGRMMGGGPSAWAAEAHVRSGQAVFATPEAARSFNDDLRVVESQMGLHLVEQDELRRLPPHTEHIRLGDFDIEPIRRALEQFGVMLTPDLLALAAFDHGNAPRGVSDRQFRFDYLDRQIREARHLSRFAFPATAVPAPMTRLQALAESGREAAERVMVMDSAPAAVLGALLDPRVAELQAPLVANVGNFHVLCFRLRRTAAGEHAIEGLFEHHTGLVTQSELERLVRALAEGYADAGRGLRGQRTRGAHLREPQPCPREPSQPAGGCRSAARPAARVGAQAVLRCALWRHDVGRRLRFDPRRSGRIRRSSGRIVDCPLAAEPDSAVGCLR